MINLRPYQQDAIEACRAEIRAGKRRVLLVAPTGAGKTVMFAHIAHSSSAKGNQVVICAHRDELLDQISETLCKFDVPHGFVAAKRKHASLGLVTVASVQTLVNRLDSVNPALIVLDEAHHSTAGSWRRIINAYPNATILGVTATPQRLDGSGLGDVFETMVLGPQVAELQASGFLTPIKYYAPHSVDPSQLAKRAGDYAINGTAKLMMPAGNLGKVTGEAITEYKRRADGQRAVVFCVNIIHSQRVAAQFCEAGYRWASLDSKMTKEARRQIVADFRTGALQGISSCDIISEGFDLPEAAVAILLRPTKSLGLYMQQVGRILRPAAGKTHAIVIDHVGNVGKNEDGHWKQEHGFIEAHREWNLDGKQRNKHGIIPCKRCPECYALNPIGVRYCIECEHEFELDGDNIPSHFSGVIVEVKNTPQTHDEWIKAASLKELLRWARNEDQLKQVAKIKGYKQGWVRVILEQRKKWK